MIYPYNNNLFFGFYPFLPPDYDIPPTLYSVLNSIVNGLKEDEENYTKIKNLAKEGKKVIFFDSYPLSEYIDKDEFEENILNHFLTRRIGFETVTDFSIKLISKLREIMPRYNKLFDALENWNIFSDGETIERIGTNNNLNASKSNSVMTNDTENEDISDRRYSKTPQNQLEDVKNGNYVTDYNFDTNTQKNKNVGTSTNNVEGTNDTKYEETTKRTISDKIAVLKQMQNDIQSIYTMIYNDLECLFYGLV